MTSETRKTEQNSPASLRLFFAVELTDDMTAALWDLSSRLQKAAKFTPVRLTWVPRHHFHLTLHFMGNVDVGDQLVAGLARAVGGVEPFELDLRHVGVFPDRGIPKVLWVGVHSPAAGLLKLREQCGELAAKAGIELRDTGEYKPHITIGRFVSSMGARAFSNVTRDYQFVKLGKCPVTRLVLMRSITGKGPARYEPHAVANLIRRD